MKHEIAALVPRDPYEAASSIADSLLGKMRIPNISAKRCERGLAHGTVTWPLRRLAVSSDNYYGDAAALLRDRTLVNFCRFSVRSDLWPTYLRRAIDGAWTTASRMEKRMFPWAEGRRICPLCYEESWRASGVRAVLWPHQAPMVEACWRHEVLLVLLEAERLSRSEYAIDIAQPVQVQYARNVVMLCRMGAEVKGETAAYLADGFRAAALQGRNGQLLAHEFSARFSAYVRENVTNPLLRRGACFPYTARNILTFIRQPERKTVWPPYLALVMGFRRLIATDGSHR